jgi:CPA2 family monovalent cation:H+ antiporter-2
VVGVIDNLPRLLIEFGGAVLLLAVAARLAGRVGMSPIPVYLLVGLAVGEWGSSSLEVSRPSLSTGAEVGVVLLLLVLGLQFTAEELRTGLRTGLPVGAVDAVLNWTPGFLMGLALGWAVPTAVLFGGITYVSSSGIISKLLGDLGRLSNRETPVVLTILVMEDLAMTVFLPVTATLVAGVALTGGAALAMVGSFAAVGLALYAALFQGQRISRLLAHRSDEVLLLTVIGLTFVIAGLAEQVKVSAAIGAFLVGVLIADPVADRASQLVAPLRDLFAAVFFFMFGLQIRVADLRPVLLPAAALALIGVVTKVATGWWAARRAGIGPRGRRRAGLTLVSRGEFSIVMAEIGIVAGVESQLGALAAAYVLILAVVGPLIARIDPPARPAVAV